jgi:hypothetical protein
LEYLKNGLISKIANVERLNSESIKLFEKFKELRNFEKNSRTRSGITHLEIKTTIN